jgi:hypothetical protein
VKTEEVEFLEAEEMDSLETENGDAAETEDIDVAETGKVDAVHILCISNVIFTIFPSFSFVHVFKGTSEDGKASASFHANFSFLLLLPVASFI